MQKQMHIQLSHPKGNIRDIQKCKTRFLLIYVNK